MEARERRAGPEWDVGVATRAMKFAKENGDSFVIQRQGGELLVALIDGLGHGEQAQIAAGAARQYVETHTGLSLSEIFFGAGRACMGTRGVVMTVARFVSPEQLSFGAVGNIEARACGVTNRPPFFVTRGILGSGEVRVRVQKIEWNPEWLFVLHSDGLRTRWQWNDFPGLGEKPAAIIAATLLAELSTGADDATALVVKREPV